MDTAEYNGARIRLSKVNHMSYWKLLLILLWLLSTWSDANDQSEEETCYTGDNCDITWTDDVPPFIVVEWYCNDTQIAQTYNESLSQDTLIINKKYMGRFQLNSTGSLGFTIKGVKKNDSGEYKCLVTLQGTGDVNVRKSRLKVVGYNGTKGESDEVELSTVSGEEERRPVSDSLGYVLPVAVAVPVVVIAAIVVVIMKKRKSNAENRSVRLEAKTRSESDELMEDKSKSPVIFTVANGKVSHGLMKQEDKEA